MEPISIETETTEEVGKNVYNMQIYLRVDSKQRAPYFLEHCNVKDFFFKLSQLFQFLFFFC